uniref:Uncharacterized protein n=1 Tax=Steinernema glaseri TaxID=37863 RepID=A0A1I8A7T1_9BILA
MEGRGKRRGAAAPEGERKRADRRGYRSVEVGCGSAPAGERVGQNDRASRLVCSAMCQPSAPGVFVPFLVEAAAEAPSEAPSPSGSASPSGAPAP